MAQTWDWSGEGRFIRVEPRDGKYAVTWGTDSDGDRAAEGEEVFQVPLNAARRASREWVLRKHGLPNIFEQQQMQEDVVQTISA